MRIRVAFTLSCLVLGAVVAAPAAHAVGGTTYTWIGGTGQAPNQGDDSTWGDADNWSPIGVPGTGDSIVVTPPSATDCHAHVVGMPAVQLANVTLYDQNINSGTCLASLSGGALSISGALTWHGGVLDAPTTLLAGSHGTISPTINVTSELDSDLTVNSTLTLTQNVGGTDDRSLLMLAGARLVIAKGATMHAGNGNNIEAFSCCGDPARVINNGTIVDNGMLAFNDVELDQRGTLDVHGTNSVTTSWGAPTSASDGAAFTGGGTYRVSGASIVDKVDGTQHLTAGFRFILGGGTQPYTSPVVTATGNETMGGTFALTGGGSFQWVGGHLYGRPLIATTGGMTILGNPEDKYIDSYANNRASIVKVTAPTKIASGSRLNKNLLVIDDTSTIDFAARTVVGQDITFYHGHTVNTGNLTVTASANNPTAAVAAGFVNRGTLTVAAGSFDVDNDYVQPAGTTTVAHGARLTESGSSSVVRIQGGRLSGTGTIAGPLSVTGGQVTPGGSAIGTLTVDGAYTQGKSGAATFDLAAHTGDVVEVHGVASIGGTLHVHNEFRPIPTSSRGLVTSTNSLTEHLSCVTTSGPESTGSSAMHWEAHDAGVRLVVRSARGARTGC